MGGKEPTFVTPFLSEYISDQAVDLLSPILERCMPLLKAGISLTGKIGTVKNIPKFFPRRGIQRGCQGKLFFKIALQEVFHDSITIALR